ncbi:MAG: PUR family DNA/RNA-binding protein [Chitinophagales bacterium]|nr:PUR family DNA/RNA-binding protein [Chitinophagales bacterium]MDW8420094.1 DUF3276 family protein [Chitinophagales bacterium]
MIDDKVLHTEKVPAGKRTYYIDLKMNQQGSRILKITESRRFESDTLRHSILIYEEDFKKIFDALERIKAEIGPMPEYRFRDERDA